MKVRFAVITLLTLVTIGSLWFDVTLLALFAGIVWGILIWSEF